MVDAMIEAAGFTEDEIDSILREVGVDSGTGEKRQRSRTRDPSRYARSGALRAQIEDWIRHLVRATLSEGRGSLVTAAARAGSSTVERAGSAERVDEQRKAIELLAAGRYAEARGILEGLLGGADQPKAIQWYLAHALLGLGEVDEARLLLATVGADFQALAAERMKRIERLLDE